MKVIGINGSPHREGNTSILLKKIFNGLEQEGFETELIQLGGTGIRPCLACGKCYEIKNGTCIFVNDGFNDIIQKMREADGVLLGSPVYTSDITPEMAALIDRGALLSHANGGGLLKHKVAGSVCAVRRAGALHAFDTMNHFLHITEAITVGASYWNMAYGTAPGDVLNDAEGMENMKVLGENMGWLLKRIERGGKCGTESPVSIKEAIYNDEI